MKNKPALLIAAHDAGGAEALSSYVCHRAKEYKRIFCIVEGPAKYIFSRKGLKSYIVKPCAGKKEILGGKIDFVLTSTSIRGYLETSLIRLAKETGIKTASILDHWTNYKERFRYPVSNWKKSLPDELWVTDNLAALIAKKEFNGMAVIKKKANFYLTDLRREYRRLPAAREKGVFRVLFLSDGLDCSGKEIGKLLKFAKNAGRHYDKVHFKIRLHPSETGSKRRNAARKFLAHYGHRNDFLVGISLGEPEKLLPLNLQSQTRVISNDCILSYAPRKYSESSLKVEMSDSMKVSLPQDLKSADLVIGSCTMALVVSRLFNKKTLCSADKFPAWLKGRGIQYIGDKI